MNAEEKATFTKLYKEMKSLLAQGDGERYGKGRAFVDALDIINTTVDRIKKYGSTDTFPLTEKQIAYVELAIEEARRELAQQAQQEADSREYREESAARMEANQAVEREHIANRTPEQAHQDRVNNEVRYLNGLAHSNPVRQNRIAEIIEAAEQSWDGFVFAGDVFDALKLPKPAGEIAARGWSSDGETVF